MPVCAGRFASAGLLASLAATAALLADQAPQAEPFRAAVDLVRLDFLALTQDGQPVTDLVAADVTLKVDGRSRNIRSFQFVRLASPAPSPRLAAATRLLPPPFGTNALDESGRTVVIIIETDSIRANVVQQATGAAAEFISGLSPRDWVGLSSGLTT